MKQIKGYMATYSRRMTPYCIEFDDCYDIVKRDGGWSIKKDGEFIDDYIYHSKWAAASRIGKWIKQ